MVLPYKQNSGKREKEEHMEIPWSALSPWQQCAVEEGILEKAYQHSSGLAGLGGGGSRCEGRREREGEGRLGRSCRAHRHCSDGSGLGGLDATCAGPLVGELVVHEVVDRQVRDWRVRRDMQGSGGSQVGVPRFIDGQIRQGTRAERNEPAEHRRQVVSAQAGLEGFPHRLGLGSWGGRSGLRGGLPGRNLVVIDLFDVARDKGPAI